MNDSVIIEKSKRGNDILINSGYEFCLNKNVNDKFYWCCVHKQRKQCSSTMTTEFSEGNGHSVVKDMTEHSHSPDASLLSSISFKNKLKQDAAATSIKPVQIIQANLEAVPSTSASSLPNKNAMRQVIYRARKKNKPKEPLTLDDIDIPSEYVFVEGERFLARDTKYGGKNRMLLFCTKQNIKILSESLVWLMDGTFKTCPALFRQIYSIHAIVGHDDKTKKTIPLVYCLLTDKTEESYLVFIRELRSFAAEYEYELNPRHIVTDFEIAIINIIRIDFPDAHHQGCLFHLGQNVWRQIQRSGLASRYGSDSDFSLKLRHLIALAYLPPDEIPEAFKSLKESVLPEEARSVTEWFETYYVLGKLVSQPSNSTSVFISRSSPMFPPQLWSINTNNHLRLPRTQNKVEAWHRRWNSLLNNNRHGLYETIRELKKEQTTTNHAIEKTLACIPKTPPRKKIKERSHALLKLSEKRHTMDLLQFLRGVANHTEL
ncbi:uncharacterized protein LOC114357115 [Ostrinia furnacalis]|uniref:uncharacterized protein LOC114357115 n=1 Tax=Ostrinia furnacalis TaxID=93504 RepID=UPI0010394F7F|nr:uncharacterized protein LOC114357115 [Ostrinia furnacalis]